MLCEFLAREVEEQAAMLGLLDAFWIIVASFFVTIPLVMRVKPGRASARAATAVAE